jgi:hypothetical protein
VPLFVLSMVVCMPIVAHHEGGTSSFVVLSTFACTRCGRSARNREILSPLLCYKARYLAASGGLRDWNTSHAHPWLGSRTSVRPYPDAYGFVFFAGLSRQPCTHGQGFTLGTRKRVCGALHPLAHASHARGQRSWRLPNNAVAINERSGVIGVAINTSPIQQIVGAVPSRLILATSACRATRRVPALQ